MEWGLFMLRKYHSLIAAVVLIGTIWFSACGRLKVPKAPNTITLTPVASNLIAGDCLQMTLQLNQAGSAFTVPSTTTALIALSASSSSVKFFNTASDCAATTPSVSAINVASGTSSASLFVRSTVSGSITIISSLSSFTGTPITASLTGTQSYSIYAATPNSFTFVRQSATSIDLNGADNLSIATSGCTAYSIFLKDAFGNVISEADYTALYAATWGVLNLAIDRNAGDAALTAHANASACAGGINIPDNSVGNNVANAFGTYPFPYSVNPTAAVGAHTATLTFTLAGISPNPTFSMVVGL